MPVLFIFTGWTVLFCLKGALLSASSIETVFMSKVVWCAGAFIYLVYMQLSYWLWKNCQFLGDIIYFAWYLSFDLCICILSVWKHVVFFGNIYLFLPWLRYIFCSFFAFFSKLWIRFTSCPFIIRYFSDFVMKEILLISVSPTLSKNKVISDDERALLLVFFLLLFYNAGCLLYWWNIGYAFY